MLAAVALFCLHGLASLGVLGLLVLLAAARAGLGLRFFVLGLGPLLPVLGVTFGYHAFYGRWELGAAFCLRMVDLFWLTSLISLTTSPLAMSDGLERLLGWGRWVGLPVGELALVFSIALRFVPTLALEADRIAKAQLARGARLDRGNPFVRARAWASVLVPLFVRAFRYADELAVAMEARGYRPGAPRSRLRSLRTGWLDLFTVLGVGLLLAGVVALEGNAWQYAFRGGAGL